MRLHVPALALIVIGCGTSSVELTEVADVREPPAPAEGNLESGLGEAAAVASPCASFARSDVEQLLSRSGPVEVNYPPLLDVAAGPARVVTVNINTGELTLWALETVGGRREVKAELTAFALVGGRMRKFPSASAAATSVSPDGRYCFDGAAGVLHDARGFPRNTLTPGLVARVESFWNSPSFVSLPPDQWWPGSDGKTDYMVARALERDGDGRTDKSRSQSLARPPLPALQGTDVYLSERYSDYTVHEVPPFTPYASRLPVLACANAVLPPGSPATATVRGLASCTAEVLKAQSWPNWSSGCVNLHPSQSWLPLQQKLKAAKAAGAELFFILSYPGFPQESLVKEDGYLDPMYGRFAPAWYTP